MINDPLYIASSHPGMVLTNTPFNGTNFHGWNRNVRMALGAKLKLGFIDGSCLKPGVEDADLQRWIRCDYMVTCWILNSMVTELSDAFLYAQSACELWKEIAERYEQSNGPLIYQFERELSKITQGKKAKKQGRIATNVSSRFDDHFSADTPFDMGYENEIGTTSGGGVDQRLVAAVCQEMMKMFKGKGGDNGISRYHASTLHAGILSCCTASFALFCHPRMNIKENWIKDTGALDHMTPNFDLFISITHLKNPIIVYLPDGNSKIVIIVAKVQLTPSLILTNVFYVPEKGSKCLYICKPTLDPVAFAASISEFQASHLNCIPSVSFHKESFSNIVSKTVLDVNTFHVRLGHTSVSKLSHIPLYKSMDFSNFTCECCMLSKHHRLPFHKSDNISPTPFHLIHVDLWGPYKQAALKGEHYFFTIVDDNTRATWTYLVHTKEQIPQLLVSFFAFVKTHFQRQPKVVRLDNGTEVVNNTCASFFQAHGVLNQRSITHTPQQNGRAERKHRHLLDTTRALRIHGKLPLKFWGECILTAAYLINKMLVKVLDWQSPFEKLYGKPPTYDHLRVIGCLCYAADIRPHKDKFANRGIKSVLIGYPVNQKGYKLYNWTKEVFLSRDVVFEETIFPFKEVEVLTNPQSTPTYPTFETHDGEITEFVNPNTPLSAEPNISDATTDNIPSSNHVLVNPIPFVPLRKSSRNSTRTTLLQDFVTPKAPSSNTSTPHYPLFVSSEFTNIPHSHIAFLANVFANSKPTSYTQAEKDVEWVRAMEAELGALERNHTWNVTFLPKGHKPITLKWVYKIKYKPDGKVDRFKARLVVRGFNQKEATAKQWPLHQLNINNAFLHGYIEEEIYMLPPEGYTKASPGQSKHEYSLFVKVKGEEFTVVLVYVDDMLITGNSTMEIQTLKQSLDQTNVGMHLNQRKYILDLLTNAGLTAVKPFSFPLPTQIKLSLDNGTPLSDAGSYRRLVGRLLYLTMTRLDISYVVQHLSQFVSALKDVHMQAAIHLLKYLKGSISNGLFYPVQPNLKMTGFSDADWASCLITRRSLTGYCIFLGHSLVSWKTKKQATFSRSSTEAEYKSMAATTYELLWLSFLLNDLQI
ncbi:retrovirus-related pol polyprotein from transposon TNT 1-94 [Tanacetum coccineum]